MRSIEHVYMQIETSFTSGITTKHILNTGSELVEVAYVNRPEKHIICFPTTVGCIIGCEFCLAGRFERYLGVDELIDQCMCVYNHEGLQHSPKPVLFSAMGEGEPLTSIISKAALLGCITELKERIPSSRFAISTTAIRPTFVKSLAEYTITREAQVKLQISLHGTTNEQREKIIKYTADLGYVIEAGRYFEDRHHGRLEWNYVLLSGINDSDEDAQRLVNLLWPWAKVKINRYNSINRVGLTQSSRVTEFMSILTAGGLNAEYYETDGSDIKAACGQLKSELIQLQSMV
jgi:23S rRNA (adenine2503-C2)-methyltransferase